MMRSQTACWSTPWYKASNSLLNFTRLLLPGLVSACMRAVAARMLLASPSAGRRPCKARVSSPKYACMNSFSSAPSSVPSRSNRKVFIQYSPHVADDPREYISNFRRSHDDFEMFIPCCMHSPVCELLTFLRNFLVLLIECYEQIDCIDWASGIAVEMRSLACT